IYEFFDSLEVKWTSIDPVRFAKVSPPEHVKAVAAAASGFWLAQSQLTDVEIAFCESVFTRSAGLQLLNYVPYVDVTADIRSPISVTPALGLPIAPKDCPHFEGTAALHLREGGQGNRALLLTARHVVLPPSAYPNKPYSRKRASQPHREVILFGNKAYQNALEAIMGKIGHELVSIDQYKWELAGFRDPVKGEDDTIAEARKTYKDKLAKAEKTIKAVDKFHEDIAKHWSAVSQHVLGHIVHFPPISVSTGPKLFTEDWALIELRGEKIDWNGFKGKVLDLGSEISAADFVLKMHAHPEGRSSFKFPLGGLLHVLGVVTEEELRQPTMLDENGEECLIVVKNGNTTGVTFGRGRGIESFVRDYDEEGIHSTSMAVAIHPYSNRDGAFSATGILGPLSLTARDASSAY
ncbi:hypothetical protein EWM64_g10535, partial [Hericium alpestre]